MKIKKAMTSPETAPTHSARPGPHLVYARDESSGAERSPAASIRILIVEDDFLVAAEAESALSEAGFEIVGVVPSAEEALVVVSEQRPDLAVIDIRLAGRQDGISAARHLLEKHQVRCVFATAHSDPHTRARAEPAKPLGWLQKPYTMTSLVRLVHQALDQIGKRE